MGIFTPENRIKCGNCGTEFDFNRNTNGCPLCSFGGKKTVKEELKTASNVTASMGKVNYLAIPPELKLKSGDVHSDRETETWGSWLMFNDFFAPKFLARVLAWKLSEKKTNVIVLKEFMASIVQIIKDNELTSLKGFPDLEKDRDGNRLVNHFLKTATNMGLFEVKAVSSKVKDVWTEKWDNIFVSLTKEGLEFARLRNTVVYNHLKAGRNGNKDLWAWFEKSEPFRDYIKYRSEKARKDPKIFQKQLHNYARSFASAKISLLRELGVVKDKRNDYTI